MFYCDICHNRGSPMESSTEYSTSRDWSWAIAKVKPKAKTAESTNKRRCDSSAFICVHLRLLKILLLITPKYRLTLGFQRISRICQSLRKWLLRVHENASRIASRHPRNRAAWMSPRDRKRV